MLAAAPIISEFLAVNDEVLNDEDGDDSDSGDESLDLTGWHLTVSVTQLDKWTFSGGSLDAGEYLVVFASGKDRQAAMPDDEWHTNFNIDGDGEFLALVRPDGSIATQFAPAFPPQREDISYGIARDIHTTLLVVHGAAARSLVPGDGSLGLEWTGSARSHEPGGQFLFYA